MSCDAVPLKRVQGGFHSRDKFPQVQGSCAAITFGLAPLMAAGVQSKILLACAACYGQSDSPLAQGMNWGIFSLLGVIVTVLACVTSFFVFLGKRASATAAAQAGPGKPDQKA